MSDPQTIAVRTEFDVFVARMQVRRLARAAGFDVTSQARIALATSSLARAMRLGEAYQGQVSIDRFGIGSDTGVRVICTAIDGANGDLASRTFTDTSWLIDELTVESVPPNNLQVTLVKWQIREQSGHQPGCAEETIGETPRGNVRGLEDRLVRYQPMSR